MNKFRFEKFEMKYGYFLPNDFKKFMLKFGGDCHFGSCSFEYIDNIANNLLRVYGQMDFHILPFGIIGNGDYYCFYRYGQNKEDYFVGIWLHETKNFIILCKSFKSFIYRCVLDDYFSTVVLNTELGFEESIRMSQESMERCDILCSEYGFDIEKVKSIKDQLDYHRLMIEFDDHALQSLCYLGKHYLDINEDLALEYLNRCKEICSYYTAPYYILNKYYTGKNKEVAIEEAIEGIKTSLILTGYSYWEEDYLEIPNDCHREMNLYLNKHRKVNLAHLESTILSKKDPYDVELRIEIAESLKYEGKYEDSLREYANALYCCDDDSICKNVLKEALQCSREGGLMYLNKIIEQDIKFIK